MRNFKNWFALSRRHGNYRYSALWPTYNIMSIYILFHDDLMEAASILALM